MSGVTTPAQRVDRARDGSLEESRLDNGIRVLTEEIPGIRSVAAGVWVAYGSAHEPEAIRGVSHLLEHMVFKGTHDRSAREIAMALERLGGGLDAYTSREHTGFQARALDEHLGEALDVLADMVLRPALRPRDLEVERQVVLEEISTVEDTPDDLVFELHGERLWNGHPYGRSILGSRDTVGRMTVEDLGAVHREHYRAENFVVAAAGHVDHGEVVERVGTLFRDVPTGGTASKVEAPPPPDVGDIEVEREGSQAHVVFGTVLPGHADDRRYPLVLLFQALGGGMGSRLFQRVREELGLAYSVYTFQSFYSLAGAGGVYVGTRPDWRSRAVEAIRAELEDVARRGLEPLELEETKSQVKGQIMLSLESTRSRLFRLAGFALHEEPFRTLDEVLERIDDVTPEEVAGVAAEFADPRRHLVLSLGPRP